MNTKVLAILLVAAAAIVAAGTGSYLAVRHSQPSAVTSEVAAQPTSASDAPDTVPPGAVAETEEQLTPQAAAPAAVATEPAPAVAPTPSATARPARPASREKMTAPSSQARSERRDPAPEPRPTPRDEPVTQTARPVEEPARVEPAPIPEPPPPPPPPAPQFEDVTVPSDAVIGLQIETNVSSETARIEDRVDARVTRDVRAGGLVAIPAGSKAQGSVTLVEKGGKIKERARLGVRFHTLVLADGSRVPIQTETILREGDSPKGESAAKIGGAAVGGAIIGAILGGGKGAAIGGAVGAGGGTAAAMAGSRNPATLPAGSTVTARLSAPATVTVEK